MSSSYEEKYKDENGDDFGSPGSRPSSSGTMDDGNYSSRPSTASRPNSRQRPYTATSSLGGDGVDEHQQQHHQLLQQEEYFEDHDDRFFPTDDAEYDEYSNIPDSRGGGDSRGGAYSRGSSDQQYSASDQYSDIPDSRGDSRGGFSHLGTPGTPGTTPYASGRPPSGRSGFSRPGTMGTMESRPGTMGTMDTGSRPGTMGTMGTLESSMDDDDDDDRLLSRLPSREMEVGAAKKSEIGEQKQVENKNENEHDDDDGHHHASYVDPSGNFVTDEFLEHMLNERYLSSKDTREKVDAIRNQVQKKKEKEEKARQAREVRNICLYYLQYYSFFFDRPLSLYYLFSISSTFEMK
jgi:hypothetical protein